MSSDSLLDVPRSEYPRPHFDRSAGWQCLNGTWDFAPDPTDSGHPDFSGGTIVVPFPWEHPASGVCAHWLPVAWYRRLIERPTSWAGMGAETRTILHFGAVHHRASVWVNGELVVEHEGGYLPFEADITDALDESGRGTLLVRVQAPVDKRFVPHGKQRSLPADDYDGCAFTPSSGIWQSVWLEPRPTTYLAALDLAPSAGLDAIEARVTVAGPALGEASVELELPATGARVSCPVDASGRGSVLVPIAEPRLWSPEDPYLYSVVATVSSPGQGGGQTDRVTGYTGLRSLVWREGAPYLNGRRLYLRGVLDQGFWPEGGHTAGSDEALRRDLDLARAAGYNLVRKHLKLEDPRWLYWADRLGMLVWAEPPSTGRFTPEAVASFERVLAGMVDRDGNHPSIVIWGAYNEEWGLDWDVPGDPNKREAVRRASQLLRAADPSRAVVDNSGWAHVDSDLVDWHYYAEDVATWAATIDRLINTEEDGFPVRLGPDFEVTKHIRVNGFDATDRPQLNGEYGGGDTSVRRGWHLRWQTQELRRHDRNCGYIYTELYDVEHETVGIYTYDRRTKDLGGTEPAWVNATTTLIVEVVPHSPGQDLRAGSGDEVPIGVRISHHGPGSLAGTLCWDLVADGSGLGKRDIVAEPFRVGDPVVVPLTVPSDLPARLHLWVTDPDGAVVARSHLDIDRN